jgi:hypothetical protein
MHISVPLQIYILVRHLRINERDSVSLVYKRLPDCGIGVNEQDGVGCFCEFPDFVYVVLGVWISDILVVCGIEVEEFVRCERAVGWKAVVEEIGLSDAWEAGYDFRALGLVSRDRWGSHGDHCFGDSLVGRALGIVEFIDARLRERKRKGLERDLQWD